ncbi:hypothetical protein OSTOST_17474, partial [Ostertagia ostertagi]
SLPKNRVFLDHVTSNRYDLYLLTETWLKDHHSMTSMLNHWINDYAVLRCDRSHRAGGGVSMFIRNTLNYTIIISESVPRGYEILAADVASPEFRLRIVLIYRPPSSTPSFSEQLAKAISDLSTVSFPVIVLGDFNLPEINWAQWDSWKEETHPLSVTFASHGFKQYIKEPTRGSNILDLLFSNDHELLSNVSVNSSIGHSDHLSISFEIMRSLLPTVPVLKRLFSKCDYTSITNYLFNILWIESFESVPTVDEKYVMFLSILNDVIDKFVPWAYVFPNKSNLPAYLQNMLEHKECLLHYAKSTGDWTEYKAFSSTFSDKLVKFNKSVEKKIVESKEKHRFFRFMKSRLRTKAQLSDLKDNGRLLLNDIDKANAFAAVFSKSFLQDDDNLPPFSPSISITAKQYADDLKFYKVIDSPQDSVSLQNSISSLVQWSEDWQIPLSSTKTFHMRIGASSAISSSYFIKNQEIR